MDSLDCRDSDPSWVCLEKTVVSTSLPVTLGIVLLASVWRSISLSCRPTRIRSSKSQWALWAKLTLFLCSSACSAANLAITVKSTPLQNSNIPLLLPIILEPLALVALTLLTYYNHQRTRRSSSISLLFWPIYALELLLWVHAVVLPNQLRIRTQLYLRGAVLLLGLSAFTLECIGPEGPEKGENPIVTANVFSKWTYGYMTPLMKKGASQYITEDDLPPMVPEDASGQLGDDLHSARTKYKSLLMALAAAYGGPFFIAAFMKIIQDCLSFLQPQLLRLLLAYISEYQRIGDSSGLGAFQGLAIAVTMFIAAVVQNIILGQYFQRCFETGMRIRAGLITAIYRKALVLSNDERTSRQTGDIVNLMSVDATRLQDFCQFGLIAISGPFQIALALVSLYELMGPAMFPGVAVMIFSIPLNTLVARKLKKLNEEQMKYRDKRTRLMSELLANIKSVKMYAWEFAFMRKVLAVRNDLELRMLWKIGLLTSVVIAMWGGIPLLVAFSSFATAALISEKPLTSDLIFPAISLFMLLQFPLAMFSQVTSNIMESVVSLRRLSGFLEAGELQPGARKLLEKDDLHIGDEVLSIKGGEFWWSNKAAEPTLRDIDLVVKKGELVGVLGRVGAGKSSLLAAIVGDMTKTNGEVLVYGSVAYAPQDPWIMSASVRDNILFHHAYDETFYSLVLEACALNVDLDILPQGDLTEVGEKGITLSGGQKARVSLARAVYARADLVLLDDVLAAVDAHVARHLFDHVIGPNGLLSTKARIVSTNGVTFLNQFDQLVYLRGGVIQEVGSLQALQLNPESNINKLFRGHHASGTSTPFAESGTFTPESDNDTLAIGNQEPASGSPGVLSEKGTRRPSYSKAFLASNDRLDDRNGKAKEHVEHGQVKLDVYMEYIKAASMRGFFLFVLAMVGQQGMSLLGALTLREWGEQNRITNENTIGYVLVYGLFSLSSTVLGGVAAVSLLMFCTLRSTKYLHDSMLYSIMKAPLSFFELTPMGRILNLFSRDTYVLDQVLARAISGFFRMVAMTVSIFVIIGWSFPLFLLALPPLGWFYLNAMKYYLRSSRELKRLDAVTKSPIFAWFSESLGGVSTVRAFNQQPTFIAKNQQRIDNNQAAYLPSININRWLALRLDIAGATIILITSVLAVVGLLTTGVDAGLVGLVLSYALNITGSLNWLVRSASEVEQNIVSVERILHYIRIPPEAPYEMDSDVDEAWPSRGEIEFREYSTRYRPDLDLVLNDISMVIKPKEKIGVCGRTGAGKSSLLLALLRIIEPASGTILIDGVDITTIGLHDLRSRITIVPQSAELHSGTLREVIDPLEVYQDADIWAALGQVHLKEFVESLPEGLDVAVSEGGSSLSSGQRQLLCFARALLRKSKVIVLDEATSAVDLETDRAIQEIIRGPQFHDVTMITIAHRLNTILDCDRILVLKKGSIAEFDSPANLLANPQSVFHSLAVGAGIVGLTVNEPI